MGSRREAFWIGVAASLPLAIVLGILSVVFDLGLTAILAVVGFLLLYALALVIVVRVLGIRLWGPQPDGEALRTLRLLRRVGVHFVQNRILAPEDAAFREASEHFGTWEQMVRDMKPSTRGGGE